jgi:hypothetical protein
VGAAVAIDAFGQQGLLPPLGGPAESVKAGRDGTLLAWHSVQTSLNAFFHTIGLYHALAATECRSDVVYAAADSDERLRSAITAAIGP